MWFNSDDSVYAHQYVYDYACQHFDFNYDYESEPEDLCITESDEYLDDNYSSPFYGEFVGCLSIKFVTCS